MLAIISTEKLIFADPDKTQHICLDIYFIEDANIISMIVF